MWNKFPALFFGLQILVGAAFALAFSWALFVPLIFLFISAGKGRIWGLATTIVSAVWSHFFYSLPDTPKEGIPIEGVFTIETVSMTASPFAKSYLYKGVLSGTPCRFYIPLSKERPLADSDLKIQATLVKKEHNYILKNVSWEKKPGSFRLAELRFRAKEKIRLYLIEKMQNVSAASFLSSMITGDLCDRTLSLQFQKLGLQHILGVSGFQFVLLSALLGALLRWRMSYKTAAVALLALMSLYFVFLGDSPPVQRAFVAITVYLLGILLNLPSIPCNTLGVALGVEVLCNPLVIYQIGFQLSFLCTFAILMTYPMIRRAAYRLFPKRSFDTVRRMQLFDQHGYIAGSLLRESLALNISVHLLSVPVLLALFHRFPLLSIPYNIFFPFCATISYFMCLAGFLFPFLHPVNAVWTSSLLSIVSNPPMLLDFSIRTSLCSMEVTIILLTALVAWSLYRCTGGVGGPVCKV